MEPGIEACACELLYVYVMFWSGFLCTAFDYSTSIGWTDIT